MQMRTDTMEEYEESVLFTRFLMKKVQSTMLWLVLKNHYGLRQKQFNLKNSLGRELMRITLLLMNANQYKTMSELLILVAHQNL